MGALTGNECINTGRSNCRDLRTSSPCNNTDLARLISSSGTHMHTPSHCMLNGGCQIREAEVHFLAGAELNALPIKKWLRVIHSYGISQLLVIAPHRVNIQRDMCAVESHTGLKS